MAETYSPRHNHHQAMAGVRSMADPIFDPQPGFDFQDDQSDHSHHSRIQKDRNAGAQAFFHPVNANASASSGAEAYGYPGGPAAFSQDVDMSGHLLNSSEMWHQNTSSGVREFGRMFDPQGSIVKDRSATVQQHFGQITPPDDTIDKMLSAERLKSDKSERARNAANQRHAKSKKARKDSRLSQEPSVSGEDDGNGDKKERYREKNRLAAAKCRAKKKENIETIEDRHRNLSALNNVLKKQVQELRGELTGLRTHALDHQDCHCQISKYNVNQARRVAMGVDTAGSPTFPGYPQRHPSAPNMSGATSSPNMSMAQQRQHSYAAPSNYAFAADPLADEMNTLPPGTDSDSQFGQFMRQADFGHQGEYGQQ